jgi:arylsulfatase A-like enzyme/Flp pilus assembly protein TadD
MSANALRRSLLVSSLALLLLAISCGGREKASLQSAQRFEGAPVIIISVDTLRSDRLPAYGYAGVETPAIDRFRADSILFERAYAHVPLTLPSHASLLTGRLPHEIGVRDNIGYRFDGDAHPTLPRLLRDAGYSSGAAVSAWVLRAASGLGPLFDAYDDRIDISGSEAAGRVQRPGDEAATAALRWIEENRDRPFFYMLHLFEPHAPYEAPEPFRSRYASSPYDGEVAAVDAIVGRFLDRLRELGLYDGSIIIFLSDHGEGLGDHGEAEHGIFLYREAIQVPLIVKLPSSQSKGASVARPVGLIDVFPTIASLTGIRAPDGLAGRSLLSTDDSPRGIFAETLYPRIHLGWSELRSLVEGNFHYIEAPDPELYDLANDPGERTNVLKENRRVWASMRDQVAAIPHEFQQPSSVDPEDAAKLQALGYLGGGSGAAAGNLPDPKDRLGELKGVEEATRLARAGRHDEAAAKLKEVVANNPRFTDAIMLLAKTLEESGRIDEAISAYRRAIEVNPANTAGPAMSLGWLYLRKGALDDAEAHAKLGLRDYPAYARILLGWIALERGNPQLAANEARAAMSDPTYRVRAMILLAQSETKMRRLDAALATIETARKEAAERRLPPQPLLEYTRGDILARMNRIAEAEDAFRREIAGFPRDRQAYANLTVLQLLQGKHDAASATMELLVRTNPSRENYELAATTFSELGATDLAASWRRRAAAHR